MAKHPGTKAVFMVTTKSVSLPIDLPSLLRRCWGDTKFCVQVLGKYSHRSAEQLRTLEECVSTGDTAAVASTAHSIKGLAANLSAAELLEAADALERLASDGNLAAMPAALLEVREQVQHCLDASPGLIAELSTRC